MIPSKGDVYDATVFKSYADGLLVTLDVYPSIKILTSPGKFEIGDRVKIVLGETMFHGDTCTGVGSIQ